MDTKSFEVMIHSEYAFDACRQEVSDYEDCRQTDSPTPRNPMDCREKSRTLVSCYRQSERIEPLCLDTFNDARECMFQSDGNVYNCRPYIKLFGNCQRNPVEFKDFLEASTDQQKKPRRFDFVRNRGHYDKFL